MIQRGLLLLTEEENTFYVEPNFQILESLIYRV